jgi:hypothetical protein
LSSVTPAQKPGHRLKAPASDVFRQTFSPAASDAAVIEKIEKIQGQENQPTHRHEGIFFVVKTMFKAPVSFKIMKYIVLDIPPPVHNPP